MQTWKCPTQAKIGLEWGTPTQGPSTTQSTALAVFCCGRDDRVEGELVALRCLCCCTGGALAPTLKNKGRGSSFAESEDDAGAEPQIILPVVETVIELSAVVIRFQYAYREVRGDCNIQAAACDQPEGVG